MNRNIGFFLIVFLSVAQVAFAGPKPFLENTTYQVCFTPGRDCLHLITQTIHQAKKQILMQAYSFTSMSIARALVAARDRGVEVKVILDKSQFDYFYDALRYLLNHKIPVWSDYRLQIAHNKVMIIDDATVITGSFNFTTAAQTKNAENLLVIHDQNLARFYHQNWDRRLEQSHWFVSKKEYELHRNWMNVMDRFFQKALRMAIQKAEQWVKAV